MIKIREDVDLKELEKYGYALNYWNWCEETGVYQKRLNHYNDYVEDLCDYFADDVRYSNMTDAEYEKEMQKEARKAQHYEAIIIYADA